MAPGSSTVLLPSELLTNVADPQKEPVTETPVIGSDPVLFVSAYVNVTDVPDATFLALAVSVRVVETWVTVTLAWAVSGGAGNPSTVSVPVAVAVSVTGTVIVSVHVNVQVAAGSRAVFTPSELLTKVAAPQLDPVTVTPLNLSDPVLVSV